jgi:hypothetical protein
LSQRINISVSDALYERLQRTKDGINISQICQSAIETAVTIEEIKLKDVPPMDKLVERLRIEKEDSDTQSRIDGIEAGKEDALEMSFEEFKALEADPTGGQPDWVYENHIEYADRDCVPLNENAFLEGWREGALSVWEEVKNTL